ncbi:hypothetical protein ARC78_02945 [Stenotrophomonas pictorum JCM 9942]|jgi:hypothetical protein|uniref:DUF2059 domain-containing protein n=1 Tax=Stenotrophomonas pictorum JCM 9942 TaxID=1236960 RepID=A0A0R0AWQ7_9GAMM|nr:DUF2059 domain-containing protein [Stenotrophomonas pictorum]KRG45160.1 hypothetical protein ARC78_02945 [Stenotrophomonas pictorum JCM 9942]
MRGHRPLRYLRFRLLLASGLVLAGLVPALATPASDGDINRLLAASRAQTMLDAMLPQMEAMQSQQFAQLTAGQALTPEQKARVQRIQQRTSQTLREALSWSQMRPMYVDLYKKSFSKEDVLAMAEFYESPAGQSLLDKTPQLMQNLMLAMQQKMTPLLADLEQDLDAIIQESEAAR